MKKEIGETSKTSTLSRENTVFYNRTFELKLQKNMKSNEKFKKSEVKWSEIKNDKKILHFQVSGGGFAGQKNKDKVIERWYRK